MDIYGDSICGNREKQEDCMYYEMNETISMSVICDGMGGMMDGDWASNVAVCLMKKHFENVKIGDDIYKFLFDEIQRLNDIICNLKDENGNKLKCGTTFASVITCGDEMFCAQVGDSKIYIYRKKDKILECLTKEHNISLYLEEKGDSLTFEYEIDSTLKKGLISYLGVEDLKIFDISKEPLKLSLGDIILICTDGVTNTLSELDISLILKKNNLSAKEIVNQILVEIGKKNTKAQDNASLVVIKKVVA